jgi:oligopeptide/dipeptide ABC transporter ATP-binding protein
MSANDAPLLSVRDLSVHYTSSASGLRGGKHVLRAVDGVSFDVARGSAFGIVGESGSGKSTTAAALMRLAEISTGRLTFDNLSFETLGGEALRKFRRRMQIVFQDPYSSLDPRSRVGDLVKEPLIVQGIGSNKERDARVAELFELVGLRSGQQSLFPHQFSGGQRQRIGIARALATYPELIICDEPVSALDVAIQAQILNLLKRLQREKGLTYVFISHDLGVVKYMCDQVAVMYLGKIVEIADVEGLFVRPAHPYTKALLAARPSIHARERKATPRIRALGDRPSSANPGGCSFVSRCPFKMDRCEREAPELRSVGRSHQVACHL